MITINPKSQPILETLKLQCFKSSNVMMDYDSVTNTDRRSEGPVPTSSSSSSHKRIASPFFRPSTPNTVILLENIATPQGRHIRRIKKKAIIRGQNETDQLEKKSSIFGTYCNLVNTIVGAGIIGMPYAIKQTGLVAGVILIFGVAMLTDKSLRLLIEMGKHVNVQSYETLMEATFGRRGFIFISLNMLIMDFGAMVAYLLVVKDTIPSVLGIDSDDEFRKRIILLVSSFTIILPLSMQRDMADLSKTSTVSVFLILFMVFIITICAPVKESLRESGGIENLLENSTMNPSTFFVGLGVLIFAFVCQDSSFIIAGSLERPTRKRWGAVTRLSLLTCGTLSSVLGIIGYLAFQGNTKGDILNNFKIIAHDDMVFNVIPRKFAIKLARGLIGLIMFTTYPLASYVVRHVSIVLLFSGRAAHEGDDHTVLARRDRRIILTLALYVAAIIPAIIVVDTGIVFSITGTVGGSCLSYLGPGAAFLGVHGKSFLAIAKWNVSTKAQRMMWNYPFIDHVTTNTDVENGGFFSILYQSCLVILWWLLLMPLWCSLANVGMKNMKDFKLEQLRKSPVLQQRLGLVNHRSNLEVITIKAGDQVNENPIKKRASSYEEFRRIDYMAELTENQPLLQSTMFPPSGLNSNNTKQEKPELIQYSHAGTANACKDEYCLENDYQNDPPSLLDFLLAISYVTLGFIALFAGLWSISRK